MFPEPARARSDCRLDRKDLAGTLARYDQIVSSEECLHIRKAAPVGKSKVVLYVVLDSNCHSTPEGCDKEEGEWLWLIARLDRHHRVSTRPVPVTYKIKSYAPGHLQLYKAPHDLSSVMTELDLAEDPIYLCAYYTKPNLPNCEIRTIRVLKKPTHELRHVPVELNASIVVGETTYHQKAKLGAVVPPLPADSEVEACPAVQERAVEPLSVDQLLNELKTLTEGELELVVRAMRYGSLRHKDFLVFVTRIAARACDQKRQNELMAAIHKTKGEAT